MDTALRRLSDSVFAALTVSAKKIDFVKYKAQWTEKIYKIEELQSKKVTIIFCEI